MIVARITISEDLRRLPERLAEALTEGQAEGSKLLVERSQKSMADVKAVASGDTQRGIAVQSSKLEQTVIVCPPPSKLIENGRPAGSVPAWSVFEPILRRWAQFKGLNVENLYPIALKIRDQGYPARFPIRRAVESSGEDVRKEFVEAVKRRV